MSQISYTDFEKVDIRTGKVIDIEDFPEARNPAYKMQIDFGPLGIKKTSAQITGLYNKDDLKDKTIIAVVNFPPKQIGNFMSEVLVLGAVLDKNEVVLVQPDRDVPTGTRIL